MKHNFPASIFVMQNFLARLLYLKRILKKEFLARLLYLRENSIVHTVAAYINLWLTKFLFRYFALKKELLVHILKVSSHS